MPQVHWEDVGSLEAAKRAIRETIELPTKYPWLFAQAASTPGGANGVRPKAGILLYGKC